MTLQRLRDLLFLEVEGGRVSIDAHNGSSQLWWIPVVFVPKPAQQERAAASRKEILRPFSDHNEELVSSLSFDQICSVGELQGDQPSQDGWIAPLQAFITEFEGTFDLAVLNGDPAKKSQAIKFLTALVIEDSFLPKVRNSAIQCLKIICRSRDDLGSLYTSQLVGSCLDLSSQDSFELPARVEALKLLLNLTILDSTGFQNCASDIETGRWTRLLEAYNSFGLDGQYIICRLLQYSALDPSLREAFAQAGVYKVLTKTVFEVLEPFLEAPVASWDQEETGFSRKVVWEAMKAIINFSLSATTPAQGLNRGLQPESYHKLASSTFKLLGVGIGSVEDPPNYDQVEEVEEKSESGYTKKCRVVNPAEESAVLGQASLWQLKQTASNVVLCLDQEILATAAEDIRGVEGLVEILHTKAALYNGKEVVEQLLPVMKALFEVSQASEPARRYIKREIFGQYARPLSQDQKKASNLGMVPDGSPSEAVLDEDPLSLRARLTPFLTHWHYEFKRSVGEFLYYVCENETHDFLRLVGYGNGVGCLADKGLPGFSGLRQQAVDIDDLMAQAKKSKERLKSADQPKDQEEPPADQEE